jgi:hypothetical protein
VKGVPATFSAAMRAPAISFVAEWQRKVREQVEEPVIVSWVSPEDYLSPVTFHFSPFPITPRSYVASDGATETGSVAYRKSGGTCGGNNLGCRSHRRRKSPLRLAS